MENSPALLDDPAWLARWDRMQEGYLTAREERFAIIARLVQATQGDTPLILDLGCGTGSVMAALLEAIPGAQVVGVDIDPTLLLLAHKRLERFGDRAQVLLADLRQDAWANSISQRQRGGVRAVVSAAALHWLAPDQLASLYTQIAALLQSGGIFLNADHVASANPTIQQVWESNRAKTLAALYGRVSDSPPHDGWDSFWQTYLAVLGSEAAAERNRLLGVWNGVEAGQPLAWHFDHLRQAGFASVDCFWRADCDAIYGGIK